MHNKVDVGSIHKQGTKSFQVALAYNCTLRPNTLINFVYDNVHTLQKKDLLYQQVGYYYIRSGLQYENVDGYRGSTLRMLMDILEDLIMLMDIMQDGQVLEKQASEIKKLTRQLETVERAGYKLKEYWSEQIYRRALCRSLGDRLHITLADVVAARKATCQAACPGQPVEGIAPSDHQMHTFYF